ncbi:MAG: hypothetical protein GBAus27B_000206 [Mycoplasmataceae bacterium]|nr:MAG: hypothetical protein GBAus27B_000206 [Mycoplasmataceae bacterium]
MENKKKIKKQEISQEDFNELLIKVKFIVSGIMANLKWSKVKPLKFQKYEEDKETALLSFEIEGKSCFIEFIVSEEDKQKFSKTDVREIVERFITLRLIHNGKNGYFEDKCPDCKQTTLTKSIPVNDPNEKAIVCSLCGWAGFMGVYNEFLNDRNFEYSLDFPKWLAKRNRWGR